MAPFFFSPHLPFLYLPAIHYVSAYFLVMLNTSQWSKFEIMVFSLNCNHSLNMFFQVFFDVLLFDAHPAITIIVMFKLLGNPNC